MIYEHSKDIIKIFKIGNLTFQVTYPEYLSPTQNFLLFESSENERDGHIDYSYHISCTDFSENSKISEIFKRTPTVSREDLLVYQNGSLETRMIRARGDQEYYAMYEELSDHAAAIILNSSQLELLSLDTVFSSLFALERRMSAKQGLILHCAYLEYDHKAILFSAPSGVGKSTQASLWEKYKNGTVINGDRALLLYDGKSWNAYGWPVCGSSEICHNVSLPIQTIVMLSQGNSNSISQLSSMQAFTELYSQITINSWNKDFAVHTMDLIELLLKKVPIYHLSCTISKEAVELLASKIQT